jgi:predicted porin
MKFYQKGSLAIAAMAIAAGSAHAQDAVEVYDQPVLLGLTVSYNAPEVSSEIEANGVVTYTESGNDSVG